MTKFTNLIFNEKKKKKNNKKKKKKKINKNKNKNKNYIYNEYNIILYEGRMLRLS